MESQLDNKRVVKNRIDLWTTNFTTVLLYKYLSIYLYKTYLLICLYVYIFVWLSIHLFYNIISILIYGDLILPPFLLIWLGRFKRKHVFWFLVTLGEFVGSVREVLIWITTFMLLFVNNTPYRKCLHGSQYLYINLLIFFYYLIVLSF